MAGIVRRGIGNPLFSPKASNRPLAGLVDVLASRRRDDESRPRRRRTQPQHCERHVSTNGFSIGRNARDSIRGRPASASFTAGNDRAGRRNHGLSAPTTDADDSIRERSRERRPASDPTAKRPTVKCDPYGLQGGSLSRAQCLDHLSTLEDGWTLRHSSENDDDATVENVEDDAECEATAEKRKPMFLQKQYYHRTFHEASRFLSLISLLATNLNHFPFLSMERIMVEDLNNVHNKCNGSDGSGGGNSILGDGDSGDGDETTKGKKRKVKGWVFRSTVRCSTYRPPLAGPAEGASRGDRGLTYHDFHLAMSVDVEAGREEARALLWSDPRG